jgi:hypothetical protein
MNLSNPENVTIANALAFAAPFQAAQPPGMQAGFPQAGYAQGVAPLGVIGAAPQGAAYNALAAYGGPTQGAANALAAAGNTAGAQAYNSALVENYAGKGDSVALANGIRAAAKELGVDPVDLATAISYETAGTFDPTKKGPTTQWGQHRGLIQFGEPQAREYGVDWSDPVGSQLDAGGAVVNYLKKNGVKPGMGLLDIYSTINAGAPGLYNRSDANNGGAPGTVRDKVENQMAGHRAKAAALMAAVPAPEDPALLLKRYGL